jgi:nitroreductase
MLDTLEAIKTRRTIRKFRPKSVSDDSIEKILEAGRLAPSGSNLQPWRFIVVKSQVMLDMIRKVSPGYLGMPPLAIVVCSDRASAYAKGGRLGRDYLAVADCSMATENMLLAAHTLGLGGCAVKGFSSGAVREILEVPDGVEPELILMIGYPDEKPQVPPKRPIDKIAFLDKYGKAWSKSQGEKV